MNVNSNLWLLTSNVFFWPDIEPDLARYWTKAYFQTLFPKFATWPIWITARRSHSGTISNLLSGMRVVWPLTNSPKSCAINLGFWLQIDMNWIFQMKFYIFLNVLLLKSYGPSKLAVKKNSRPFGFETTFYVVVHRRILAKIKVVKVHKLWALTAPIPLAQNECLVLHLKDPIHTC